MRFASLNLLLALLLVGCASTRSVPEAQQTRRYEVPKDRVMTAVTEALEAEGYTIDRVDPASGLITAAPRTAMPLSDPLAGTATQHLRAQVTDAGPGAELTLAIDWTREQGYARSTPMAVRAADAQAAYETLFARIESQF